MSYSPYEYVIEGVLIPKKGYTQQELVGGKKEVIELSDVQLAQLKATPLFNELLTNKEVRLMKELPDWAQNGEVRLAKADVKVKEAKDKAQEALNALTKEREASEELKAEATSVISKKDKEIAELQAKLAKLTKKEEK